MPARHLDHPKLSICVSNVECIGSLYESHFFSCERKLAGIFFICAQSFYGFVFILAKLQLAITCSFVVEMKRSFYFIVSFKFHDSFLFHLGKRNKIKVPSCKRA